LGQGVSNLMAGEQEILERFVEWGKQRDLVRAMLLTSSRAIPTAPKDILSDYDIILVVREIHPFFNDRSWLGDFGPVLALYHDPILCDGNFEVSSNVVQYENGFKADFTLWPVGLLQRITAEPELPDELDAGYIVLIDKDGLTAGLQPPTYAAYIPTPPTKAEFQENVEVFFVDTCYVAKFLWRDDLIAAKHVLDHFAKQEHLIPLLVWHVEIDHQWSVKPGLYGRYLKQWLRPDLWTELENTYTGAGLEENWEALFRTAQLFRKVAVEVGQRLGYAYPQDLDRRAVAYLRKIRSFDPQAEQFP
jgi:aminoglycoside 6-adenylyltransferase